VAVSRRNLVWVRAEVIGHDESADSDGKVFRSRFRFDADGQGWEVVDEYGFGWRAHAVGSTVWLGFPLGEPARAGVQRLWPAAIGVGIAVAGGLAFWLAWNRP
jgi:hypothetical protein